MKPGNKGGKQGFWVQEDYQLGMHSACTKINLCFPCHLSALITCTKLHEYVTMLLCHYIYMYMQWMLGICTLYAEYNLQLHSDKISILLA